MLPAQVIVSLLFIRSPKGVGRLVGQAAVRSLLIILSAPASDHDLCLSQVPEPLHVQAFVTQPPVEAFAVRILPRAAGLNVGGLNVSLLQPLLHGPRNKLWSIITPYVAWCAAFSDHAVKHLDDLPSANAAGDLDRQAFPRKLICQRQDFEPLAIRTGVMHKIVGPHLIGTRCFNQATDLPISPSSSRSTSWQAQAFLPPDAMHPFDIHHRQLAPHQGMNPAVPVARMLARDDT